MKEKIGMAWAWQMEDGSICFWAEPTKKALLMGEKPSPEARAVSVFLVSRKAWGMRNKPGGPRRPSTTTKGDE